MEYLTAMEIAKKWNISNRMVAYYCEKRRMEGAVKKGKVWLIPAETKKPIDKRFSKKKVKAGSKNGLQMGHNNINEADEDNLSTVYHTGDVSHNLGLTRETLRYYEEIGLIKPKRSQYNQYREFDFYDMSHLMAIDFYKKRGFSPLEMKDLLKATSIEECKSMIRRQTERLHETITSLQEMLQRLKTASNFCQYATETIGKFEIMDLPLYYVRESLPSVASFGDYRDKVLSYLNEDEDILSNMVRMVTFDEKGYKSSEMYLIKPVTDAEMLKHELCLEDGKSLHTTFVADNNDTTIMEKMFIASYQWATENDIEFRGVAYIFIRFVMISEQTDRNYYEVWIPLK